MPTERLGEHDSLLLGLERLAQYQQEYPSVERNSFAGTARLLLYFVRAGIVFSSTSGSGWWKIS